MRLFFGRIAAAADFAYLPVAVGITAPAVNMAVRLSVVFCAPVGVPPAAHDADSVAASCRHAVCFTAFLAQIAVRADRSAIRANLIALHADIRTVLAGVTPFTHNHAVCAILMAILAQGDAILAPSTVQTQIAAILAGITIRAKSAAFAAIFSAIGADHRTVLTGTAPFTQNHALRTMLITVLT